MTEQSDMRLPLEADGLNHTELQKLQQAEFEELIHEAEHYEESDFKIMDGLLYCDEDIAK